MSTDVKWGAYPDIRPMYGVAPYLELHRRIFAVTGLRSGQRVLDGGCGPALALRLMLEDGIIGHYTGIDKVPEVLAQAQEYVDAYVAAGGTVQLDECDLSLPDATWPAIARFLKEGALYDVIILNHSVMGLNIPAVLRTCARLARPGTHVAITLFRPDAQVEPVIERHRQLTGEDVPADAAALIAAAPAVIEAYRHLAPRNESDVRKLLRLTGWELVSIEPAYAGQDWLIVARRSTSQKVEAWVVGPEQLPLAWATRRRVFHDLEWDWYAKVPTDGPLDQFDAMPGTIDVLATVGGLPVACARARLWPPLQSMDILAANGVEVEDADHSAEGMRVGVLPEYHGPNGLAGSLVLEMVALMIREAIKEGRTNFIGTILPPMMLSQLRHGFPWRVAPTPVHYPPEKRGPATNQPVWLVVLSFAELLLVMSSLNNRLFELMGGAEALDRLGGEPDAPLEDLVARTVNARLWVKGYMAGWNHAQEGRPYQPQPAQDYTSHPRGWARAYHAGWTAGLSWPAAAQTA